MIAEAPERPRGEEIDADLLIWRFGQLRRAGYEKDAASELAARLDVDLHVAQSLLERGCPEELALRILR